MNPIPSVQAMLICEKIIEEAQTGKKSLIGIFNAIHVSSLPSVLSMGLYAKLTDGEGIYQFRFDTVHLPSDKKIASATTSGLESTDRLKPMEVVVQIPGIEFENAGKYEFQMYANDVFLGHVSVDIVLVGGQ